MRRLFTLALAMGVLGSALGTPARAQGDVTVQSTDPSWRGSYFNNPSLAGPSAHQRSDPEVAFNWGAGSPVPGVIGSDHFSARWERYYDVPGGLYRVDTTSDDGIRVKVDGRPVIDAWYPQAAQPRSAEVNLSAGHHLVVVEYFEQTGDANVRVGLVAVAGQPTGWAGKYYNNRDLAGAPAMTRTDLEINFDWRNGSPQPGTVGSDNFSVRWTRRLGLAPGSYRFSATTDDGVRLWVNEHLLIDRWYLQGATTVSGDIYVPGSADVRMEYFEATGNAVAKLVWSPVGGGSSGGQTIYVVQPGDTLYSIAKRFGTTVDAIKRANGLTSDAIYVGQRLVIPVGPTVPEVIVDNGTTGFATGGSASGWVAANAGYGGTMIWTLNNQVEQPSYNWARWYPALAPGRYEVFAYIPSVNANTHAAKYWVVHTGGFTSRVVDQYRYSNVWVSLGTYQFAGNGQEYVSLNDITGEPYASRRVGFDAVKWVPR